MNAEIQQHIYIQMKSQVRNCQDEIQSHNIWFTRFQNIW